MRVKKIMIVNKLSLILIIIFVFQLIPKYSFSVDPEEFLKNNNLENRARDISQNIRCMICQNQSIDESSAPLAKDLRIIIRNKLTEGNTDQEIYNYLIYRYGEFILLKPQVKPATYLLWFLPFIFLFIGIFIVYYHNKKSF